MGGIIKAAHLERIEPDLVKQAELAKAIEHNIIILGGWTINWLNLSNRPTPTQRKAGLKRIEKAARTLAEKLKALDGDSASDLRDAVLSDPFSKQALGTNPEIDETNPSQGYAKFQALLDIIGKLEQWATIAQERTRNPKDGR